MGGHSGEHPKANLATPVQTGKPLKFYSNILLRWAPNASRFGILAGLMALYFVEWPPAMKYVPLYGSKYEKKDPIV